MSKKLRVHGVHGPMGYYCNVDDMFKQTKTKKMYIAEEKVTTVVDDVIRAAIKDGDEKVKLSVTGDGYGASYLSRSEVIELIEKLAKVAEQLPK